MGNTPSSEEAEQKSPNTNMQNSNNRQGWQPPKNVSPNANMNAPNNQVSAPGWSIPPPQQQTTAFNKDKEANAQPPTPVASGRLYPTPPEYNNISQPNQTKIQPQNPTAPPATYFTPQQIPQTGYVPPPQHFGTAPNAAAQQYYSQPQTIPQPQQPGMPQFFPQPQTFSEPKFFSQKPVNSGNKPHPVASMPLDTAALGIASNIWVAAYQNKIPHGAFQAGHDTDGSPLFICRAGHAADILPGKVVPSHSCAYVAYNGREHSKNTFEVLVGEKYRWVATGYGKVLPSAVEGGRTSNGEKLYIGRVNYKGSLTPGKVHPSHKCIYIPYGGEEKRFDNYELLVHA